MVGSEVRAQRVDDDAVVDLQPGGFSQLDVRQHTDAHQHHIGFDAAAVVQFSAADAHAIGQQAAQHGALAQVDAARAMQCAEVV